MVLCALKSVDQNTKHTCMGWGGGTHGSLLIVIQEEGQNGPMPPFLEIFSKKTLFRK